MANVPLDTRFIGFSDKANLAERKTANLNAISEPYTMQDIVDTAGGGGGVGFPTIQDEIQYINNSLIYNYVTSQTIFSQELRFPSLTNVTKNFLMEYVDSNLVSAPNLTTVGEGLQVNFSNTGLSTAGTTVQFPSLTSVGGTLNIQYANLESLNLSSLTSVGRFQINFCPILSSIDLSSLTSVSNNTSHAFSANILNEATVNAILIKLAAIVPTAASPNVFSIDLSGGTNATPTGAGMAAANTLSDGGWAVFINQ